MKKWLIGLLAAVLLLGGCSPRQAPSQPGQNRLITVGFSQAGAESDWRVAYTESMRSSLNEDAGYELLFSNARQQQDNQLKAIRTFIQQKVDYIVLAPVTETGWDSVLKEAKQAGIPVIIVDRQGEVSDPSLYCSWVGSDFRGTALPNIFGSFFHFFFFSLSSSSLLSKGRQKEKGRKTPVTVS